MGTYIVNKTMKFLYTFYIHRPSIILAVDHYQNFVLANLLTHRHVDVT